MLCNAFSPFLHLPSMIEEEEMMIKSDERFF